MDVLYLFMAAWQASRPSCVAISGNIFSGRMALENHLKCSISKESTPLTIEMKALEMCDCSRSEWKWYWSLNTLKRDRSLTESHLFVGPHLTLLWQLGVCFRSFVCSLQHSKASAKMWDVESAKVGLFFERQGQNVGFPLKRKLVQDLYPE